MSILGFPLKINIGFFMMAGLLGMGLADLAEVVGWIGVVTVSVLLHELGHALAARRFGCKASIQLYAFGGLTSFTVSDQMTAGRRMLISLAGPGAGFVAGGVVLLVAPLLDLPRESTSRWIVYQLLWVNLGWGALNLLPIMPLDGGHVVEAGWEMVTGRSGTRPAQRLSIAVSAAAVIAALAAGWTWAALVAGYCGWISWTGLKEHHQSAQDEPLLARIDEAWTRLRAGRADEAETICGQLLEQAQSKHLRASALEVLAWAKLDQGDPLQASAAALQMAPYKPSSQLVERLTEYGDMADLARDGDLLKAAETGIRLLQDDKNAAAIATFEALLLEARTPYAISPLAYNAACALARTGRVDDALARLTQAVAAGFEEQELLDTDPDLEPLRSDPRFGRLLP